MPCQVRAGMKHEAKEPIKIFTFTILPPRWLDKEKKIMERTWSSRKKTFSEFYAHFAERKHTNHHGVFCGFRNLPQMKSGQFIHSAGEPYPRVVTVPILVLSNGDPRAEEKMPLQQTKRVQIMNGRPTRNFAGFYTYLLTLK